MYFKKYKSIKGYKSISELLLVSELLLSKPGDNPYKIMK